MPMARSASATAMMILMVLIIFFIFSPCLFLRGRGERVLCLSLTPSNLRPSESGVYISNYLFNFANVLIAYLYITISV